MTDQTFRVAAAQMLSIHDVQVNTSRIAALMRHAAEDGCRVVVFHEGALTGYCRGDQVKRLEFDQITRSEAKLRQLAEELKIGLVLGSASRSSTGIYNDVLIVDDDGRVLGRYAKTWRSMEPEYEAGTGPVIFRIAGVEATVIICHDLRYPELVRLAVTTGAQIVFICNNESGLAQENKLAGYRAMQIARATESMIYAVMANAAADPDDLANPSASHGNSMIVDPMGNILNEAGWFEQRLVVADLVVDRATRFPVMRMLGESNEAASLYQTSREHPALADWVEEGRRLVRRLK